MNQTKTLLIIVAMTGLSLRSSVHSSHLASAWS